MPTSRTHEEIQRRIDALPQDIQDILYSNEVADAVQKISAAHQLHIDQMGSLEADIINLMTGFIEPKDFPNVIAEHLEIDPDHANVIAHDLDNELFLKVRALMQQREVTSESVPSAPAPRAIYDTSAQILESQRSPEPLAPATPAPTISPKPVPSVPVVISDLPVETYPELAAPESPEPRHIALSTPTAATIKTIDVGVTPGTPRTTTLATVPPPAAYTVDPYHEPIS